MSISYAQKSSTVQKAADTKAASVLDSSSQGESLQRKAGLTDNAAQLEESPRPNNTGMPDNLKSGIECLSGFSMDNVRVHYNSSKPATVQALAYTQGTDIHVAPGQEKCLPHEAWHVAQQMAGRVSPTTNINGMPVNDNAALEHEADVMGEKALQRMDDKSSKNKKNFSCVVQCKNDPAYFETENDDGCSNSRYFIHENSYERVAPINSFRSPNQEYHTGPRNFVYYKAGPNSNMGNLLYDVFKREIKIGEKDYIQIDKLVKFYLMDKLMHAPSQKNCDFFNYKGFLDGIRKKSNAQNRDEIANECIFDLINSGEINKYISKKAMDGFAPFDWSEGNFHPGHPIANGSVSKHKSLTENEKLFYETRHKFASEYARSVWKTVKIGEKEMTPEKQMDDYFCEYWNQAIKEAENKGEELYMKKHALFCPGRVHYTKQQARNIGRKKFTESFFLSLTSKDATIKKYLDLLKSRYLDRFENFKSFYCF